MHGLFDVYYHFQYSKILLNLVLSKRFQVLLNSRNIYIYSTIRMYSNMIKDYFFVGKCKGLEILQHSYIFATFFNIRKEDFAVAFTIACRSSMQYRHPIPANEYTNMLIC